MDITFNGSKVMNNNSYYPSSNETTVTYLCNSSQLQTREKHIKKRQQQHYDQRHKATDLTPLQKGQGR